MKYATQSRPGTSGLNCRRIRSAGRAAASPPVAGPDPFAPARSIFHQPLDDEAGHRDAAPEFLGGPSTGETMRVGLLRVLLHKLQLVERDASAPLGLVNRPIGQLVIVS